MVELSGVIVYLIHEPAGEVSITVLVEAYVPGSGFAEIRGFILYVNNTEFSNKLILVACSVNFGALRYLAVV